MSQLGVEELKPRAIVHGDCWSPWSARRMDGGAATEEDLRNGIVPVAVELRGVATLVSPTSGPCYATSAITVSGEVMASRALTRWGSSRQPRARRKCFSASSSALASQC